jgi:glycosyl transferase family 25
MRAYLINLDAATDRRAFMEKALAATRFTVTRIPAVDGRTLSEPIPDYDEAKYHRRHGRTTKPGEIGCYLSHVEAWRTFLATGDAHGLICEDDLVLGPDLERVVGLALSHASCWNLLRLSALGEGHPAPVLRLDDQYSLAVNLGRLKGTGAYLIDRRGAAALVAGMLPMWLPFDHALDREWAFGLSALRVFPWPCSQTDKLFRSTIQGQKARKLSTLRRCATTYPYQVVNELSRWFVRGGRWLRLKAAHSR